MITTTRWSPDTCGCVIEYEWDTELPAEQRVHTDKSIIKCAFHSALTNPNAHAKVKDENTTKNKIHGQIIETCPELCEDVIDDDGNVSKKLKKGVKYDWSFDVNRDIQFDIIGATTKQKKDVLDAVKLKLGKDKIKLK